MILAKYQIYSDLSKSIFDSLVNEFVNAPEQKGATAIFSVDFGKKHQEIIKFLVAKGAMINIRHNDGRTLLHRASQYGSVEIVQFLIEKLAANTKAFDKKGSTPLQLIPSHVLGQLLYCCSIWVNQKMLRLLTKR